MDKWDKHRVLVLTMIVLAVAIILLVVIYGPAQ